MDQRVEYFLIALHKTLKLLALKLFNSYLPTSLKRMNSICMSTAVLHSQSSVFEFVLERVVLHRLIYHFWAQLSNVASPHIDTETLSYDKITLILL